VAGDAASPDPLLVAASAMVFVDEPGAPILEVEDLRHLLDVLRLRPGQAVVASDGRGAWVPCRVAASAAGGARRADPSTVLEVVGEVVRVPAAEPSLTVAFAPVKGDRPEWVVQKLTELGVDRIVPLRTSRSVVRWDGERALRAGERLRRVAREAAAQCRRSWLPEIAPISSVGDLSALTAHEGRSVALAHPGGPRPTLRTPVIAIGPEGGWDDDELGRVGRTVGLGPTVLRAETAALMAGALLTGLRSAVVGPLA
jgi:16S rRNA (uracil1498-N3)-methyltransferase